MLAWRWWWCVCVCVCAVGIDKCRTYERSKRSWECVCVRYRSCTAYVCVPADTHQKETCEAHFPLTLLAMYDYLPAGLPVLISVDGTEELVKRCCFFFSSTLHLLGKQLYTCRDTHTHINTHSCTISVVFIIEAGLKISWFNISHSRWLKIVLVLKCYSFSFVLHQSRLHQWNRLLNVDLFHQCFFIILVLQSLNRVFTYFTLAENVFLTLWHISLRKNEHSKVFSHQTHTLFLSLCSENTRTWSFMNLNQADFVHKIWSDLNRSIARLVTKSKTDKLWPYLIIRTEFLRFVAPVLAQQSHLCYLINAASINDLIHDLL